MTQLLRIAVAGCTGRMGQTLIKQVLATPSLTLAMASERSGSDIVQVKSVLSSLGASQLPVTSSPEELAAHADAVIDFTSPSASLAMAAAVAKHGGAHIIGTTGFTDKELQTLAGYGASARIVQSGNFSLGVNLLARLVTQASRLLDENYDIEIFEMHHRHKKDAPSGTALLLGQAAADGRSVALNDKKIAVRDGVTGERRTGDIGFSVARGGDVVGIHSVYFAGPGELIEFKHQGFSRDIYARGALHAAQWAAGQAPGFYSMQDVLK